MAVKKKKRTSNTGIARKKKKVTAKKKRTSNTGIARKQKKVTAEKKRTSNTGIARKQQKVTAKKRRKDPIRVAAGLKAHQTILNKLALERGVIHLPLERDIQNMTADELRDLLKRERAYHLDQLSKRAARELARGEADDLMEDIARNWVSLVELPYQSRRGGIALYPSRLRHLGVLTDELELRLKRAARRGPGRLHQEARDIAEALNVPVKEVYTLYYSP